MVSWCRCWLKNTLSSWIYIYDTAREWSHEYVLLEEMKSVWISFGLFSSGTLHLVSPTNCILLPFYIDCRVKKVFNNTRWKPTRELYRWRIHNNLIIFGNEWLLHMEPKNIFPSKLFFSSHNYMYEISVNKYKYWTLLDNMYQWFQNICFLCTESRY